MFITISCLQLLLVAKLGAPTLMDNELYSLLITNLLFTSILNPYSLKGKLDGLKPLFPPLFKSSSGLVLLLWFLTLYLSVLPRTTLAVLPLLLPHPLPFWTPFWKNILCCASLKRSLILLTLKFTDLHKWLGLQIPILSLFISSLLPC